MSDPVFRPVRGGLSDAHRTAIEAWLHGERRSAAILNPAVTFNAAWLVERYGPIKNPSEGIRTGDRLRQGRDTNTAMI
jgi:hypothetical protein